MPEKTITKADLADRLNTSVRTLERWLKDGPQDKTERDVRKIESFKVGQQVLFVESSADAFIRGEL